MMPDESRPAQQDIITFHYIKSNFFRVIYADGAFGGINPQGLIRMALYNERTPIPQTTVQPVTPEGRLGDELIDRRTAREGFVREVEVDVLLNINTAKSLIVWLQDKVKVLEAAITEQQAARSR